MVKKEFIIGVLLGLSLAACAGAAFPYKYYGLDLVDKKLLGPTPTDDLDLSVCDAIASNRSPCIAVMGDAMMALKQDYLDTKNQLIDCQHQLITK
jgi:hypothetical protein